MNNERWLSIPGYDNYEVSDRGRVRSWAIPGSRTGRAGKPKILKQSTVSGYRRITLCGKSILVHRLVLTVFVGACPDGKETLHRNDIETDNRLSNLRWGTHTENIRQCVKNNHHSKARNTKCPQGHDFSPENTRIRVYVRRGSTHIARHCKQCQIDRRAEQALKRFAQRQS